MPTSYHHQVRVGTSNLCTRACPTRSATSIRDDEQASPSARAHPILAFVRYPETWPFWLDDSQLDSPERSQSGSLPQFEEINSNPRSPALDGFSKKYRSHPAPSKQTFASARCFHCPQSFRNLKRTEHPLQKGDPYPNR